MENEVKLTKLAKCAGCGAKVGAGKHEPVGVQEEPWSGCLASTRKCPPPLYK